VGSSKFNILALVKAIMPNGVYGISTLGQQHAADAVNLEGCLQENHPFVAAARTMILTLKSVLVLLKNQEH
jgi:hypothetical protein